MSLTEPTDQRTRILDTALHLMAEGGVHAMSMRRLASACGLNVATLYHYFPSKAELLDAVVAQQDYAELLSTPPPVDIDAPARERLAGLLRWIWNQMAGQDDMWRLLLGESLRGDAAALGSAAELSSLFEQALGHWLDAYLPELAHSASVTRVLRGSIFGFFIEYLPLPFEDRLRYLGQRADEIAEVLVPV
jgi:AcrR family transcriptional regulator